MPPLLHSDEGNLSSYKIKNIEKLLNNLLPQIPKRRNLSTTNARNAQRRQINALSTYANTALPEKLQLRVAACGCSSNIHMYMCGQQRRIQLDGKVLHVKQAKCLRGYKVHKRLTGHSDKLLCKDEPGNLALFRFKRFTVNNCNMWRGQALNVAVIYLLSVV